ncbi:MAG: dTDP-4-dehydrorhamnose reductase [Candidatus Heimdallarchaeota archaeon LC_2]|nr:MAG: dTDP-4-dehydrorhamnose reductase [Candidatus Heimdallarchaeota archaeon LC_2]
MSVLLIGSEGQLGTAFQHEMKKQKIDYFPVGIDILDITNLFDLRDYCDKNKISSIINCAAYNLVDESEENWETAYSVNSLGPRNLALVSNKLNIPLIHYSSDYVFDGTKGDSYTIYDNPNPINKYGESKYLGEKFITNLTNRHIIIRTSWVFGEGKQNFVYKLISWAKSKNQLKIVHDEISAPTNTDDLAKVSLDLLEKEIYGLFHITNEGMCSRYEWAELILRHLSWDGELLKASKRDFNLYAKRPEYSKLSTFGLEESIGYKLPHWEIATKLYLDKLNIKL